MKTYKRTKKFGIFETTVRSARRGCRVGAIKCFPQRIFLFGLQIELGTKSIGRTNRGPSGKYWLGLIDTNGALTIFGETDRSSQRRPNCVCEGFSYYLRGVGGTRFELNHFSFFSGNEKFRYTRDDGRFIPYLWR